MSLDDPTIATLQAELAALHQEATQLREQAARQQHKLDEYPAGDR
jgi:hypothetical protein